MTKNKADGSNLSRRRALSLLGLAAAAGYAAPSLLNLTEAKADPHGRTRTRTRTRARTRTRRR